MLGLITWIVLVVLAIVAAIIVVHLIAKPMRALLGANSYMAPAQAFYVRAFALALCLGALAAVVGRSIPGPEQGKSMAAMEYVWWVANGLEPAFWSISLFLFGFVVVLTIVLAVLGRYRDQ